MSYMRTKSIGTTLNAPTNENNIVLGLYFIMEYQSHMYIKQFIGKQGIIKMLTTLGATPKFNISFNAWKEYWFTANNSWEPYHIFYLFPCASIT